MAMKTGSSARSPRRAKPRESLRSAKAKGGKVVPSAIGQGEEVTFRLEAPRAMQVFVAGSFNHWSPRATPLQRNRAGTWTRTMSLGPGEREFMFVVDGFWCDAPAYAVRRSDEDGSDEA
jgi:1,4-alpha-glucan branching enzyme